MTVTSGDIRGRRSALVISVPRPSMGMGRRRLSRLDGILYGIGDVSNATKTVIFGLFVLFYYVTVLGVPATIVGGVTTVAIVLDAMVEPWIGQWSDRAQSSVGRHRFLVLGALTGGATFWLLFAPPSGLSGLGLIVWLLVFSVAVRIANALFVVPYYALGAELSQDYHERTAVTAARGACALVGTVAAAGLSFVVFFPNAHAGGADPKLNPAAYPLMGASFGALIAGCALLTTLATRRWHLPSGRSAPKHARAAFRSQVATALRTASFRRLFIACSLVFLGTSLNGVLTVHFLTYYVRITDSRALSVLELAFYGAGLVGVGIWLKIGRRVEKARLCVLTYAAAGLLLLGAWGLFGPGHVFGTGNVLPLALGEVLAGLFTSAYWVLPYSMLADVADEDELRSGQRREGLFVGVFRSGQQVGAALSVLVTGVLVDSFAGLVPGQAEQSALTIERIGLLAGVLPAALLIPAALLLTRYPLSRARVRVIQQQLAAAPMANR